MEDWRQQPWFHALDLGDGRVTPGRFGPETPPNYTLFGFFDLVRHTDLSEAACVDVGTMDGLAAFVLAGLGARSVTACDLARRDTFLWAREQLGYDRVDYRTPVAAHDLPGIVGSGGADVIVLAGVLYHVHDPLAVLVSMRESLRLGGLLFVETHFLRHERAACMRLNPADDAKRRLPFSNVYWRPSKAALRGMLELSGFEVVATRIVNARLTMLACARRPHDVDTDHELIRHALRRVAHPHYRGAADFHALQRQQGPEARVRYDGPTGERLLYRAYFDAAVPHQPAWNPPSDRARHVDAMRSGKHYARLRLAESAEATGARLRGSWESAVRRWRNGPVRC